LVFRTVNLVGHTCMPEFRVPKQVSIGLDLNDGK
jgi:hypothetical protein